VWQTLFSSPRYNLIDTERPGFNEFLAQPSSASEQLKRWTLGSTLLGDGYYTSHGYGAFGDMWWEPEYDLELGWPTGPAYTVDIQGAEIWRRDFTGGEVWVNPTTTSVGATEFNPAITSRDAVIAQNPTSVPSGPAPSRTPAQLSMEAPYPNPTTESAAIQFRLDPGSPATLRIFDISGRLVSEVWTGVGTGATQTALWNGQHEFGYEVGPGIYFATLTSGGLSVEKRIVRLR
jgi:hypothetical protein